jgi:hypothetical protein
MVTTTTLTGMGATSDTGAARTQVAKAGSMAMSTLQIDRRAMIDELRIFFSSQFQMSVQRWSASCAQMVRLALGSRGDGARSVRRELHFQTDLFSTD